MRILLALLVLLVGSHASASDEPAAEPDAPGAPETKAPSAPLEIGGHLPLSEMRVRKDDRVLVCLGGCSLEFPDMSLSADRIVLWLDPVIDRMREFRQFGGGGGKTDEKAPRPRTAAEWLGPIIRGVYASGQVRYERRDTGLLTIEAERLVVDFQRERALILKARLAGEATKDESGNSVPLIIHAETVRQVAEGVFRTTHASITTCEFVDPHYRLEVDDVTASTDGTSWKIGAGDAVLRIGSIPVLWLPFFETDATGEFRPFKSARVGRSSRFGYELETLWGDDILIGEGDDERRWGEWELHADWRTRRGPGLGLDLDYETGSYLGRLRTYYQHDRAGRDRVLDAPVPKDDRGRVWLQHRFLFPDDYRLDLETHLESDRAYRSEFLERESREDKLAETYAQLRKRHENIALFALGRVRANGHHSRTEYAPRLVGSLIGQPVVENLFGVDGWRILADVEGSLSEARRRYDDDLDVETTDWIERGDLSLVLRSPFGLGPLRVTPRVAARGTAFSETLDDDGAEGRFAAEAGVRLDVLLHRVYPGFRSDALDLDGLRHLVHLDLEWLHRGTVRVDPEDLVQLDELDTLDETHRLTLRVRNRFQTRRGPRRKVVNALDVELEAEYYPRRETVRGRRVQGLAFLEARVEAPLSESITVRADADYDQSGHEWLTAAGSIRYRPGEVWAAAFEQRFTGDEQNLASIWVDHRPTARYGFRGYVRQNLRAGRLKRAGLLVRRFGHDWTMEIDLRVNRDLDDVGVLFSLSPRGFGGGPRPARDSVADRALYGESLE